MADVKISALPLATTPLAGTEVLPIVQSATTDQVSVANLTAGRAVSAASLTLTTTPLAVGSGGTGLTSLTAGYIPFGAGTSAFGNDSNLFWDNTNKYLGIGTTSPSYKLDVNAATSRLAVNTTSYAFTLVNNTGGNFYTGLEASSGGNLAVGSSGYAAVLSHTGAYSLQFGTNNNIRATIDSSGNLLVGTTSAQGKLVVKAATNQNLAINSSVSLANSIVIAGVNDANSANIPIEFRYGTNCAFLNAGTEAMRLDTSGNVLVGTTSTPYTQTKAAVNGGTFYNQRAVSISTSGTTLFEGIGGIMTLRANSTGGTALIIFDVTAGVTLVNQSGSIFTTSAPTANEIQISVGSTPYRVIGTAGSSKNNETLNIGTVICQ